MSIHTVWLLTFTTYGTWLPGDARGWHERRRRGSGLRCGDPRIEATARARMRQPPMLLAPSMIDVVVATIDAVASHRGWALLARSVDWRHVHIVVGADVPADRAMVSFKAWCSRRLREAGLIARDRIVWTDGGTGQLLDDADSIQRAKQYVDEQS